MPSTKLISSVRRTWSKEVLDYVDLNEEFAKVQRGLQAHSHTLAVGTDTDANDSGNAIQLNGNSEIQNGTIPLTEVIGTYVSGEFAGKLNARLLTTTTHGTPGTEWSASHGLGRIPVGYIVIGKVGQVYVYDGTTTWTNTLIYLRASHASISIKLIVF